MSANTNLTIKVSIGAVQNPPPGSEAAGLKGCSCPVFDNCRGSGWRHVPGKDPIYVITANCPLHDPQNLLGDDVA